MQSISRLEASPSLLAKGNLAAVSTIPFDLRKGPEAPKDVLLCTGRPGDENTIFVKGFDSSLGEEGVRNALTETFSKYGKVNQVRLPTDRETGDLKGIGFVEFEDQNGKVSQTPSLPLLSLSLSLTHSLIPHSVLETPKSREHWLH